jgi:hypothetical protein
MTKVVGLMAGLSDDYRALWMGEDANPKISRGENYQGLPWVMLDYPRFFGREDIFAIRTLFWWGHTFSVTLHLKGSYRDLYGPVIERNWAVLAAAGFHAGVSADEWRHEHEPGNYGVLRGADDLRRTVGFLKLSAAVGLHRWKDAPDELLSMFKTLISVLFDG